MSAPALGVHRAFGNALAVLVRKLLDQLIILHQQGTAGARAEGVLVIRNRITGAGGQLTAGLCIVVGRFVHDSLLFQ